MADGCLKVNDIVYALRYEYFKRWEVILIWFLELFFFPKRSLTILQWGSSFF